MTKPVNIEEGGFCRDCQAPVSGPEKRCLRCGSPRLVPDLLAPLEDIFRTSPGKGLFRLASRIRSPMRLRDLGLSETDLDRAADIASENPYANPRPIERDAIRSLLQDAFDGREPET